ncbi:MAG: preprotein translocase subunit SecG [Elusimicrobiota bacterium]
MYGIMLTLHIVVCVLVILVVLIQSGKGAGLSNVFGGGGGDALFSAPSGSMFIRKLTTGLAAGFFLTCLILAYLSAHRGRRTVTRGLWTEPAGAAAPALPGAGAPSQAPASPPAGGE